MIAPILLKEYVMDLMEPAYACLDLEETTVEVIIFFFKVRRHLSNTDTGMNYKLSLSDF